MEDELPSRCKIEMVLGGVEANRSVHEEIYSIPAIRTTHPRYCLIVERAKGSQGWYQATVWDVIEVEVDLGIPGPIKGISGVSTPVQSGVSSFCHIIEHKREWQFILLASRPVLYHPEPISITAETMICPFPYHRSMGSYPVHPSVFDSYESARWRAGERSRLKGWIKCVCQGYMLINMRGISLPG